MIWHIFRKDSRLLRTQIIGVALAHAIAAATWIAVGPFEQRSTLVSEASLLSSLALMCMVLMVAMAVHEDPLTGVARDWSVRPIRRRDMLLAKVLFALIAAHGPLLIIDFVEALAFGFPVTQAAGAAAMRCFALFCSITLPAMVIAAFTRTMTAWIVAALIWTIGTAVLFAILANGRRESTPLFTTDVLAWIPHTAPTVVILCASALALPLLYTRKFVSAAGVTLAGVALASLVFLIPWPVLFELQRSLSPRPDLASGVHVGFDADEIRLGPERYAAAGVEKVLIPLRLSGLADDRMLVIDNAAVRLVENGSTVFQREDVRCIRTMTRHGSGITCGERSPISAGDDTGTASTVFALHLPLDVYERVSDRPMQIEIDFALTLLDRTANAPLTGQEPEWFDVGGNRCLVRRGEQDRGAQLGCLHTTRAPVCQRTFVNANAGVERSIWTQCRSTYSPFAAQAFPDVIDRTRSGMSAGSHIGMQSQDTWRNSTVRLVTYVPQAHFRRSITIPAIRLGDQPRGYADTGNWSPL